MPRRPTSLFVLALALGSGCSPEPIGRQESPVVSSSRPVTSTAGGAVAPLAVTPSRAVDSTPPPVRARPATQPAADSTVRLSFPVHRDAHDSVSFLSAIRAGMRSPTWAAPRPEALPGAVLPAKRIVAFYGNPLSKRMGVLGEYPVDDMLARLDREIDKWRAADPSTPVQPALHLIAVVAQGAPGRDGMYRLRMPDTLIERVYQWAQREHALLFLDVQVAKSTVQLEIPRLLPFLSRPDVHLGLDPEFSMHYDREGLPPGRKIGTMDASDVNYAIRTLAQLVSDKQLPPKVLVVHRFTQRMLRGASDISVDPRVQVVVNMDGWGPPWLKFDSYRDYEVKQPVEFTGFKLFFHNDTKKGDPLITPAEIVRLVPKPMYIQYQ